jgi:putative SOS response-associated peptidase YedK
MCGRYGIQSSERELLSRFDLTTIAEQLPISFNVAPGMTMPVVVRESPNRLELMRWGLIPSWAKDEKIGYRTINARAETVAAKPAFRKAFRSQRCLVPASGFYEWQKTPRGTQPYWISVKGESLVAFAGLWDAWQDPQTGDELHTYTILTCGPNALMEPIHNRMPVILERDAEAVWLDPDQVEVERLQELLHPFPARQREAWPVSAAVNNPRRDSAELIAPLGAAR